MANRIHLLDSTTINQIAAGEVVEDSCSAIKELIENSIDSGARTIILETKGNGRERIVVTDDGCGMEREELPKAVERHATSKLRSFHDLSSLYTMGFRGEALAAISSVSILTITSRVATAEEASMIVIEGGTTITHKTTLHPKGTTVEVRNLFYNVPVRRAFQKTPKVERQLLFRLFVSLALSHPDIAFRWIEDGKESFSLPHLEGDGQTKMRERLHALFGESLSSQLLTISSKDGPSTVEGYLDLPTHAKSNRSCQYLFINRRLVYSSAIQQAIERGYGTSIESHRHPSFFLHLQLPQEEIDVNVHPQKKTIRLKRESQLCDLLSSLITDRLQTKLRPSSKPILEPYLKNQEPHSKFEPGGGIRGTPSTFFREISWDLAELKEETSFPPPLERLEPRKELITDFFTEKCTPTVIFRLKGYLLLDGTTLPPPLTSSHLLLLDQLAAQRRIAHEELRGGEKEPKWIRERFLSDQEAAFFIQRLLATKEVRFCPEGKAIFISLDPEKIASLFTRNHDLIV